VMGLSERRACQIISADRKTIRYQSNRPPETELRAKLRELANERRRFGYRRLFVLLRREGEPSGVNRIYRLYREEGLSVRKRKARRRAVGTRAPILVEAKANARWSLDFVHDQFACGRRFRVLNIVDDVTRECLAAIPDTSISGRRVARELTMLIERRGKPGMIVSDNGTGLTSNAILAWSKDHKVEWHYIAPGKPMQNGYVESFMYRRPRGRKRLSANFRSSYACVHVFGLCLRPRQWSPALMEYADRGLINGSRLNAAPKALRVYSILSSAG